MASKLNELEKEMLQLSAQERAGLAKNLILSLDGEEDDDAEFFWIEEAKQRSKEYKEGKTTGKPVDDVFTELRSKFQQNI
jgi:putative addiction module component (TIGR02574 family)